MWSRRARDRGRSVLPIIASLFSFLEKPGGRYGKLRESVIFLPKQFQEDLLFSGRVSCQQHSFPSDDDKCFELQGHEPIRRQFQAQKEILLQSMVSVVFLPPAVLILVAKYIFPTYRGSPPSSLSRVETSATR